MRILKIADVSRRTPGGVLLFMRRSGEALEASGHQVDCLFREDLFPRLRGRRRRLILPWLIPLAVLRRERAHGRYDVVEIQYTLAAPYCALARRLARSRIAPCVAVTYNTEELKWREWGSGRRRLGKRLWLRFLIRSSRTAFRRADQVMAPSDYEARYLRDELGIPEERLTRVDSGVGDEFFEIEQHETGGTGPRILFAGAWIENKGAPDLVSAWRLVAQAHPTASLSVTCTVTDARTVLGDFDGSAERVSVHPLLGDDELRSFLAAHDLFVLPSRFEGGISCASLQAAAAGLPCVVTAVGGHEDLFRPAAPESDGAVLVPPHDHVALADAIGRLARDPSLRRRLGRNARARARSFSWRETAGRSLEAYRAAVHRESATRSSRS
jgi:glycosyltransferase involved in cell wall biosynthesis